MINCGSTSTSSSTLLLIKPPIVLVVPVETSVRYFPSTLPSPTAFHRTTLSPDSEKRSARVSVRSARAKHLAHHQFRQHTRKKKVIRTFQAREKVSQHVQETSRGHFAAGLGAGDARNPRFRG
eukprot:3099049-Rhodomonas_salina.1